MSVTRSKAKGDAHDEGYKRPFTVVPDDSLERVNRDVTATFEDVPIWAVQALFHQVHDRLGRPDVGEVKAHLIVEYSNMSEGEYQMLLDFRDLFWTHIELDVTKTRPYPPYKPDGAE
jgi:hypothetical protein